MRIARTALTPFFSTKQLDGISQFYWNLRAHVARFADDIRLSGTFLSDSSLPMPALSRLWFIIRCLYISLRLESPHSQQEILAFTRMMLLAPPGVIVEAGCFKGSSTAKFSLIAKRLNRTLVVFDSFQGIPENREDHKRDFSGNPICFAGGSYAGTIEEVVTNVDRYGHVDACRFVRGWFVDTMPTFKEPIAAAYLDVDLVSSTQTCLKYLYPLIMPGGFLTSQDGHLPLVVNVLLEWQKENNVTFTGLGVQKLVWFCKPRNKAEESSKTEGIFCQPKNLCGT